MKTILSILVALGIPAAFWNYYLKESPNVQYSLSAAIPLKFADAAGSAPDKNPDHEFVQQIEIANSGRGEAKKIIVKIPAKIVQYSLTKHAVTESPTVTTTNSGFELNYAELPPASGFQITVKTDGTPLKEDQLTVSHQSGVATIASPGSKNGEWSSLNVSQIVIAMLFILAFYFNFRGDLKYAYVFRKKFQHETDKLLKLQKPWYIRQQDWPGIIFDLVSRMLDEAVARHTAVSKTPAYKLLANTFSADDLPQERIDKLKDAAAERLAEHVQRKARASSSGAEVLEILNIEWPANLSESKKTELLLEISNIYADKTLNSSNVGTLVNILSENKKPANVPAHTWDRLQRDIAQELLSTFADRLLKNEEIDLTTTPEAWKVLPERDLNYLLQIRAERLAMLKINETVATNKALINEIERRESAMTVRENQISREEEANTTSRQKILLRLNVIERLISEPAYIDRIEPDDDTFSPGNWELLRNFANSSRPRTT